MYFLRSVLTFVMFGPHPQRVAKIKNQGFWALVWWHAMKCVQQKFKDEATVTFFPSEISAPL